MTRAPVFSFLLLVAVSAILAVFFLLDQDPGPDLGPGQASGAVAVPEPHDEEPVPKDSVWSPIPTDAYTEERDQAEAAPESARAIARYVTVISARGQPVAGAGVQLVRVDQARQRRQRAYGRMPAHTPYRTLRTDRRGRAPLHPLPRSEFRIEASTAEEFGAATFKLPKKDSPAHREIEVRLKPTRTIRVNVKQEDGSPASGVRVDLYPPRTKIKWYDRIALWTDDDGRAFGRLTIDNKWARGATPRIVGSIHLITGARVSTPPVAPVNGSYDLDLTLPRVGTLLVSTVMPDGSPYSSEANVMWWRASEPPKSRRTHLIQTSEGTAVIGGVPPGERLIMLTKATQRDATYVAVDVDPSGATQEVALRVGPLGAAVTATLTTAEGDLLAHRDFRFQVTLADDDAVAARMAELDPKWNPRRIRSTRTGSEGEIRFHVRAGISGEILVFFNRGKGVKGAPDAGPEAVITFPPIEEGASHEAGLIPLPSYRLLAAGHVLDSDDAPVPNIKVSMVLEPPATPGRGKARRPSAVGLGRTDRDGAFTLLGPSPGMGELRIHARTSKGEVAPRVASLGARNLRLRFVRFGGLLGSARLADPTLPLRVDVKAEREDLATPKRVNVARDRGGAFRASSLPPGVYRVRVFAGGIEALDLHGIQVPEGETVMPGPIADLLVGQNFRHGRIITRDRFGAPTPKIRVSVRERGIEPRARAQSVSTDGNGEATISWRPGVPLDVHVRTKGWSRRYRNPRFPLQVTIGERDSNAGSAKSNYKPYAPPLIVIFDGRLPRHAAIRRYDIAMEPPGGAPKKPKPGELRLERTRILSRPDRAEYIDVHPGTYDARLELTLAPRKPGGRTRRVRVPLGRIWVRGTPRERVTVRIDPSAIEQAVRTANQRPPR